MNCCDYGQRFSITNKWAQKATVFVPGNPLQPSQMEHSSLLGLSLSCEKYWL
jgi:hypothetical protein